MIAGVLSLHIWMHLLNTEKWEPTILYIKRDWKEKKWKLRVHRFFSFLNWRKEVEMSAKVLHSLTDENPDLHKQVGCMNGMFQVFNRRHFLTGRRISSRDNKRLPPGISILSSQWSIKATSVSSSIAFYIRSLRKWLFMIVVFNDHAEVQLLNIAIFPPLVKLVNCLVI